MVKLLKKGSKIHIKKSHEGRFTEYCGGEVTDECIQRGKRSPDPAVRKQATFAANARKFKHQQGGELGPTGNGYGGKGAISDSDLYKNYEDQQIQNRSDFDKRQQYQQQMQQYQHQLDVNKANQMGTAISGIVGDFVAKPIAQKIQENREERQDGEGTGGTINSDDQADQPSLKMQLTPFTAKDVMTANTWKPSTPTLQAPTIAPPPNTTGIPMQTTMPGYNINPYFQPGYFNVPKGHMGFKLTRRSYE